MDREKRISLLKKFAKKIDIPEISGKQKRKDIERYLEKLKKVYSEEAKKLSIAINEKKRIDEIIDTTSISSKAARREILKCYNILQEMDMTGASLANVKENDVFYAINGKWHKYDPSSGDIIKVQRKKKEENLKEENLADDQFDLYNDLKEGIEIDLTSGV
jgi:hypothetical protein